MINNILNNIDKFYGLKKIIYGMNRYRITHDLIDVNKNIIDVLDNAFGPTYDNDPSFANMYNLYNGNKGMDWWNFPWNIDSQYGNKYVITFEDMAIMLTSIEVKMNINDDTFVRYSAKLKDVIFQLNPTIMNNHGGYKRVIKIIYCIRNFASVVHKENLWNDVKNIKSCVDHLLSIDASKLEDGPVVYKNMIDVDGK